MSTYEYVCMRVYVSLSACLLAAHIRSKVLSIGTSVVALCCWLVSSAVTGSQHVSVCGPGCAVPVLLLSLFSGRS